MRRWWWIPVIGILLIMQAKPLQAAYLKNLAVLKLLPAWNSQRTWILDPPCGTGWKFQVVNQYLEASIALGPPNPSVLTDLGRALWLEGDCTGAVAKWEQAAIDHDPAAIYELFRIGDLKTFSPDIRLMLANYAYWHAVELTKDPKNEAASKWFNRAFELVPQHRTVDALIQLHQKKGESFDASVMWQKMINMTHDTEAEHWYAVGSLDNLNANWEAAAKAFIEGAKLTPDSYEFWLSAGIAWENVNNWKQAVASFERATQVTPEGIDAYLSLGNAYRAQQKYQTALDWYTKAMELFPQNVTPYSNSAYTFFLMGDYVQARRNLEAALGIDPSNSNSMYILAQISYREKNPSLADSWLLKAINLEPDSQVLIPWWMQLGDWRLEWHNCSGALEAYTNASKAGGNEEIVQQKLKMLAEVCHP